MVKFKTKMKGGRLIVTVKLSGEHMINERELGSFAQLGLRGFLRPMLRKPNLLEYSGPMGISLQERLKFPMTKSEFFFIVEEIVAAVQLIQSKKLALSCVVWDLNCTYYNQMTRELLLLYLPLNPHQTNVNLTAFLESLIYGLTPAQGEATDYVSDFRFFLYSLSSFSPEKIESYVASVAPDAVNAIKRYKGSPSGFMAKDPVEFAHHEEEQAGGYRGSHVTADANDGTGIFWPDDQETGLLDEQGGTVLLGGDGTAPLDEPVSQAWPTLERLRTGERIVLNKPSFRLGTRYGSVDGYLGNNVHISGHHLEIVNRGGRCYAKDLGSTNKTRLNGGILSPMQEAELHSGDTLTLADEDFTFRF